MKILKSQSSSYGVTKLFNQISWSKLKKAEIILEPLGELVTQFTYANNNVHLDLKPLQKEILDICQSLLQLNHYLKDYTAQANTTVKIYFNGVQPDIL